MPFSNYTSVADVAKAYQITLGDEHFVQPLPFKVSQRLRDDLDFAVANIPFRASEFARCENLVFPILKEAWIPYSRDLQLWPHTSLSYDKDLCGTPDYFLAKRSPLGTQVMEKPLLMVMEAKRDDFEWGWGQCLAAMVAAQKLNDPSPTVIHGITTNGDTWQFGRLQNNLFVTDPGLTRRNLEQLCGALAFLFEQCRQQLAAYAGAA
jgi:hypothetical protein